MMVPTTSLRECEDRLRYRFADPTLLEAALTHRSAANELGLADHYERLEFLGDTVLGLVAADWLYERFPEHEEGDLSKLKGHLVSEPVLAAHAQALDLGSALRLGVGEERSGGREKASLLSDVFEAVLGAVYVDGGLESARSVVTPMLEVALARRGDGPRSDSKSRLQEICQGKGWELPAYLHVGQEGPDHQKLFTVECWVAGSLRGTGAGRSKKLAEQRAAAASLASLEEV